MTIDAVSTPGTNHLLKDFFNLSIVEGLAGQLKRAFPDLDAAAFVAEAGTGLEPLSLTERARHIMVAMRRHLPSDVPQALAILTASLGPAQSGTGGSGMSSFRYLPHVQFVSAVGLPHFEAAMAFQYAVTKRFTAEFSIRTFLEHETERTLAVLHTWATDPDPHVRRLVSEGTRPRLPWAARLKEFQRDPGPVLALLETLKDDPDRYVQRSVANNLNDIGKDHPDLLVAVCRRWSVDAPPARQWVIRHALRHAVKRGDAGALAVLGFGATASVRLDRATFDPSPVPIGGRIRLTAHVTNVGEDPESWAVDCAVHFVKASGKPRPKVFKMTQARVAAGETITVSKVISLQQLTTRKHFPGDHAVALVVNGKALPAGSFQVLPSEA